MASTLWTTWITPYCSSSETSSSSSSIRTMPPPFLISPNSLPCLLNLSPNAFLAPAFEATSQICTVAFEPAAAIVSGVSGSGENRAVKILPYHLISHDSAASTQGQMTHKSQVPTRHQANLPLSPLDTLSLLIKHVPDLDRLVHAASGDTSPDMRVDVQSRRSAVMCGQRVLWLSSGE